MRRCLGHVAWVAAGALALFAPSPASAVTLGLGPIPGPAPQEGQRFDGVILTASCSGESDISAISIDWADGSAPDTSSGSVADRPNSTCDFSGSHTYAEGAQYPVKISYTSATYGSESVSVTETVVDTLVKPVTTAFAASAGVPFSGPVAMFSDHAGLSPSGYGASINWGDGTSAGIVSGNTVSGSHTYQYPGTYGVSIALTDDDPPPPGIAGATGIAFGAARFVTVGGSCPGTPVAPAAPFTATAGTANADFIQALYHDLLGEPVAVTRAPALVYALDLGAPRDSVVRTLLSTNDYRARLIESQYQSFLHRQADGPGFASSLAFLAKGGSDEQLVGYHLLASPEYIQTHQNDLRYAEYCDVLQRPLHLPDPFSPSFLNPPQLGPALVALPEYRQVRVSDWFEQFMRRAPSPAELDTTAELLAAGETDEQVIASLLSSPSYFGMFKPKRASAGPAISPHGAIRLTLTRPATIEMDVLRVLADRASAAHGAATTATPPLATPTLRQVGALSFGRRRSGHVTITWSRSVNGRRLVRGRYLLQLKSRRGATTTELGDAIPFRVR